MKFRPRSSARRSASATRRSSAPIHCDLPDAPGPVGRLRRLVARAAEPPLRDAQCATWSRSWRLAVRADEERHARDLASPAHGSDVPPWSMPWCISRPSRAGACAEAVCAVIASRLPRVRRLTGRRESRDGVVTALGDGLETCASARATTSWSCPSPGSGCSSRRWRAHAGTAAALVGVLADCTPRPCATALEGRAAQIALFLSAKGAPRGGGEASAALGPRRPVSDPRHKERQMLRNLSALPPLRGAGPSAPGLR
jgi:hypothetical protein